MAGTKNLDDFKELLSPFIKAKIFQIKDNFKPVNCTKNEQT